MANFWYMLSVDKYWTSGLVRESDPIRMPGVKCRCCGETWGDFRFHRLQIPRSMRSLLRGNNGPIGDSEFNKLKLQLFDNVKDVNSSGIADLRPGASFLPEQLECERLPPSFFTMGDQLFLSGEAGAEYRLKFPLSRVSFRDVRLMHGEKSHKFTILISEAPEIIPNEWTKEGNCCSCCGRVEWDRAGFDDDFRDTTELLAETRISRNLLDDVSISPLVTTCYYVVSDEVKNFISGINPEVEFVPVSEVK